MTFIMKIIITKFIVCDQIITDIPNIFLDTVDLATK